MYTYNYMAKFIYLISSLYLYSYILNQKSYVLTIHMTLYVCIIFRPKAKNDDRSYENNADVDINVLDDYDMFQLKCLIIS